MQRFQKYGLMLLTFFSGSLCIIMLSFSLYNQRSISSDLASFQGNTLFRTQSTEEEPTEEEPTEEEPTEEEPTEEEPTEEEPTEEEPTEEEPIEEEPVENIEAMSMTTFAAEGFKVTIEPDVFTAAVLVDINIEAVNTSGNIDTAYIGDLLMEIEGFSYPDPNIVLPSSGTTTINSTDQGVKYFPQGLTVNTPGIYTFVVSDVFDPTIIGDFTFEVLAATSGGVDTDGDGLTDQEEDALGTDPDLQDTDLDGLDDGDEILAGTDPLDPDSDDDGMCDGGLEVVGICSIGPDPAPNNPAIPMNVGGVLLDCGIAEVYGNGDGSGVTETYPGLCADDDAIVINFEYFPLSHTWGWGCSDDDGNSNGCTANELWCGDNNASNGEVCDGSDLGTCGPTQTCNGCICEDIQYPGTCGERDDEILYTFTPNELALIPESTGLCSDDELVVDFGYDDDDNVWVRKCQGAGGNSPECSVAAERCGDGAINGTEVCDGQDDVCGEGGECTPLCVCLQNTISGSCGDKFGEYIYDNSGYGAGLSSLDLGLCTYGRIEGFEYDEEAHIWTWNCKGVGGAEDGLCYAQQERCGDGITNAQEQCDDGNTADGDGCSQYCTAESLGALAPARKEGCGNAINDLDEQCDDGNLVDGDGCDRTCKIEDNRRCTLTSPSQCGTLECFKHGERYTQHNIYGQCCGGLEGLPFEHIPEKLITRGVQMTVCYDKEIDTPYCLPFAPTPGWYAFKDKDVEKKSLLLKDSCVDVYKDYYKLVNDLLNKQHSYCQYTDEDYDRIDFNDIDTSRKSSAIEALVEHCIVKGPGDRYTRFRPDKNINRAEFVKILIKTMYIGQEYDVQRENTPYLGDTYFTDISRDFRGAQYIAKAYELGLLDRMFPYGGENFMPYKSMTTQEVIAVMKDIDLGQAIAPETVQELFLGRKNPTRGDIAMLMVTKWRTTFRDYLLLQGQNESFLGDLLKQLKGQHFAEQYRIIVEEIYTLDRKNEHFAAEVLNPGQYLLGEYLKGIAK